MRFKLLISLLLIVALANIASSEDDVHNEGTKQSLISHDTKHQLTDQADSNSENKLKNGTELSLNSKNESLPEENLKKPCRKLSENSIGAQDKNNQSIVKKHENQVSGDSVEKLKEAGKAKELPETNTTQEKDGKPIITVKESGSDISKVTEETITEAHPKETDSNETEKQLKEKQPEKQNDVNKAHVNDDKIKDQQLIREGKNPTEKISKVENISTEEGKKGTNDDGKESVQQENRQSTTSGSDEIEVRAKKKCSKKRKSSSSSSSSEEQEPKIEKENDDDNNSREKTKNKNISTHPERIEVDEQKDAGVKDCKDGKDVAVTQVNEEKKEDESSMQADEGSIVHGSNEFKEKSTIKEPLITKKIIPLLYGHEIPDVEGQFILEYPNLDGFEITEENVKKEESDKGIMEKGKNEEKENQVGKTKEEQEEKESSYKDDPSKLLKDCCKFNDPKTYDPVIPINIDININLDMGDLMSSLKENPKSEATKISTELEENTATYYAEEQSIGMLIEDVPTSIQNKMSSAVAETYEMKEVGQEVYKLVSVPFQEGQENPPYQPFKIVYVSPEQVLLDNIYEAGQRDENEPADIVKYILMQKNAEETVNEMHEYHHFPEDTDLFDNHNTLYYGRPEEIESRPGPDFEKYDLPYVLMGNMFDKEGTLRPNVINILKTLGYDSLVDQFYEDDVLKVGSEEERNPIDGSKMQYHSVDHSHGHEIIDYTGLQQNIPDITGNIVYTLNSIIGEHFNELSKRQQSASDTNNVYSIVLDEKNMVEQELQLPEELPNHSTTEVQTKPNILIKTPSVTPSNEIRLDRTSSDYKELGLKDYYYPEPLPYTHDPTGRFSPPEIVSLYPSDRKMNSDQYHGSLDSHVYNLMPLPYINHQMGIHPPPEIVYLHPSDRPQNGGQYQGDSEYANDLENALIVKPNSKRTFNDGYYGIIGEILANIDDKHSNSVEHLERETGHPYGTSSDYDESFEDNEYGQGIVPHIVANVLDPRVQLHSMGTYHDGAHLDGEHSDSTEHFQRQSGLPYNAYSGYNGIPFEANTFDQGLIPDILTDVLDPRVRLHSEGTYYSGAHQDKEHPNNVEHFQRQSGLPYNAYSVYNGIPFEAHTSGQGLRSPSLHSTH